MKIYVLLFKDTEGDKTTCVSEDIFKIQSEVQAYFLGILTLWNVKFEKCDDRCVKVYGNFDGYSIVRESEQENHVEVDGKLMDYKDFENWLYAIKH